MCEFGDGVSGCEPVEYVCECRCVDLVSVLVSVWKGSLVGD